MPIRAILLLPTLFWLGGCSPPAVDGVDAWGNVTWGGKPITSGMVTFTPTANQSNGGHQGWATVAEGRFDTRASGGKKIATGPCTLLLTSRQPSADPAHPKGTNLVLRFEKPIEISADSAEVNLDIPANHKAIVVFPDGGE